ncbi:hypothetical protein KFE25_012873 [Diacronema lutheri]|uniref:Exostosin GT47 domain-containing protein n=1 Tax=Diacronema lutheri TaxID=2081491 RepID=A0A8J5XA14_DIALT|nr:hypothetical protein KFE25_012873 [Diacronema lutheri]
MLGTCKGIRQAERIKSAHKALQRSPHFRRAPERHFWVSSKSFQVTYATPQRVLGYVDKRGPAPAGMRLISASLAQRIFPLNTLLARTTVGRMKSSGRIWPTPRSSAVGRCTFDTGHQPNQVALRAFSPHAPRPIFLFFAGGLDVCCTGRRIRCEVGQLLLESADDVHVDVGLRGDVLRSLSAGASLPAQPCTMKALELLARKRSQQLRDLVGSLKAAGGHDDANSSKYEAMGRMMAASIFCLCPAGDICTTSRFVTTIAAGCIPVVICDKLQGPFGSRAGSHLLPVPYPYESFWIKYPTADFVNRPAGLLEFLRAMSAAEIAHRQEALAANREQVLLQISGSRRALGFSRMLLTASR